LVRYGDFADLMEEAFTKKGLERKPTATLDSRSKSIALAPPRSLASLAPEEEELCECVVVAFDGWFGLRPALWQCVHPGAVWCCPALCCWVVGCFPPPPPPTRG
jgi:hypothetical protein